MRAIKILLLLLLGISIVANPQVIWKAKKSSLIKVTTNGGGSSGGGGGGGGANLNIQGYGVNAAGADAGDPTITVTSTTANSTASGSLYWAIFTATGGTGSANSHKKIVFDIAGAGPHTISYDDPNRLEITTMSNVTFDGGNEVVQITSNSRNGLSFQGSGCHNVLIKNLYFINCGANDNNSEADGLNVLDGAHDFAITNCVFYGNTDGNIDFANGATNCTLQYSIIGNHIHNNTAGSGGTLITTINISLHHNIYNVKSADEGERAPFIHGNYADAFADVRNNIIYNYGRTNATGSGFGSGIDYGGANSGCGCYAHANFVNNYYYTPSTAADQDGIDLSVDGVGGALAYSAGNVSGNGFNFNTGIYTNHAEWAVASQYQIEVETACTAMTNILAHVGPTAKSTQAQALIDDITQKGSCAFNSKPRLNLDIFKGISVKENDDPYGISYNNIVSLNMILHNSRRNRYLLTLKPTEV